METVTEVSESIGSFIQMVTVFRPEGFLLMFFMDLETVDSSASELVGKGGRETNQKGRERGKRKK